MQIPVWLRLLVSAMVVAFGGYRIVLSFRSDKEDETARRRGGLYAFQRRTHLLFGVFYLLVGGFLLFGAFR